MVPHVQVIEFKAVLEKTRPNPLPADHDKSRF